MFGLYQKRSLFFRHYLLGKDTGWLLCLNRLLAMSTTKEVYMLRASMFVIGVSTTMFSAAATPPRCQQQVVEKSVVEICVQSGAAFQHDTYTLTVDKVTVFALVDDYAEKVSLEHAIPDGETIELPLSKQGVRSVQISGGCVPESKGGAEIARVCNFSWGKHQIVKNIRFEFE